MIQKLIETQINKINVNQSNFEYIAKSGVINGTLLTELRKSMNNICSESIDLFIDEIKLEFKDENWDYLNFIKVDCFSQNGEFIKRYNSVRDICIELNVANTNIYSMLNNKKYPKTIKGFVFKKAIDINKI